MSQGGEWRRAGGGVERNKRGKRRRRGQDGMRAGERRGQDRSGQENRICSHNCQRLGAGVSKTHALSNLVRALE